MEHANGQTERAVNGRGQTASRHPLEVFFCTCPNGSERDAIADSCLAIWNVMDVEVFLMTPEALNCSAYEFQSKRRIMADRYSKRDVYIVADDDCIPYDIEKAVHALRSHAEFAILSLWPSNAEINRWTPEDYEVVEDLDVMEHFSVGGIRVCRKGAMMKGWPPQMGKGYDTDHCEALRACGWRVGYSQHSRMFHAGEGKSTLWYPSSSPAEVLL